MKEEQKEEDKKVLLPFANTETLKFLAGRSWEISCFKNTSSSEQVSKVAVKGMNMIQGMFEVPPETLQSWKLFDNHRQFRSHQICTSTKVKSYLDLV